MAVNIPESPLPRVVIVGAGFAGLSLARSISDKLFQVVLLDKFNYHQFQPLFYQVATAGLEPSAISFPLRKIFHGRKNVHVRIASMLEIQPEENTILTSLGALHYDYLVLAHGADTNYFGKENIRKHAMPMKSVAEALALRNKLLENFEKALTLTDPQEREALLNVVVVGAGPTGVEVSGTLAEMKKTVLPKDYPELNFQAMQIYLIEASPKVLGPMSEQASGKAKEFLEQLGVVVMTNTQVSDYDGKVVQLGNGQQLPTNTLVWAAGVRANPSKGLPASANLPNGRITVNEFNQVLGLENIFAIGDIASMSEGKWAKGHPQVAQPAIQQGALLAKNLVRIEKKQSLKAFRYKDLGSMATIGRNLAVVDLSFYKFQGFFAWLVWMFVHLMSILGVKNRLLIFINWCWNYVTYDQSLRLIMKPEEKDPPASS
ncbi:MAG: NAD(P)/FAD-dependent oxidoreductase [Cytophagaceae bacterium]|jgi:NADH dehydrogenase|nr:NAD(P)/FAD-dependent oxidoreductase [Cytophagaceae bacterium]